ncbi:helix-turn-helix protein [Paenibacillus pabuli]|uniref:Helix-turn-helix protein n=1 Tax=Paenibacillus pabuli TaxID=1472 RepID=A0A855Y548_9BACL|nr:helix-turn-helix protein [Paenibacillus pabuli]PXW05570.1 helix-turn-helix protein [Paenibacillus taichungensis]
MVPRVGRSRLPILLKENNTTQSEFARKLGVTEAFISQIVAGKKKFSYDVAARAAFILGCTMEELHDWE